MYESAGAQFFDDSDINLAYGKNNFKEEITMISKEKKAAFAYRKNGNAD